MGAHWLSFFEAQHLVPTTHNYSGIVISKVLSSFFNTLNLVLCSICQMPLNKPYPKCNWEHTPLWSVHCMNILLYREHLSHQLQKVTKASCTLPHWLPKMAWEPTHQHSFERKKQHISHGLIFQGFVLSDKRTDIVEILFDGQVLHAPCFASSLNSLLVHGFLKNYIIYHLTAETRKICTHSSHSVVSEFSSETDEKQHESTQK